MLKILFIVIAVLFVAVLVYAARRPDSFRTERATVIKAPPEKIFPLINDFRRWDAWSPWEKVDPAIKRTYGSVGSGKGAVYEWRGNKEVGQGRMEIIDSSPSSKLVLKIDFIAPFEAHNTIEFTLAPQGDSTTVTQAMFGPSPYFFKLMGLFINCDKMVGEKQEEGLANLKAIVES